MTEPKITKSKSLPLTLFVAALDYICFVVALVVAYQLWLTFPWPGNYQPFARFAVVVWVVPPLAVIVFKIVGLYKPEMGVIGVEEQSLIFKATWIVYLVAFSSSFFYRVQPSRLAIFYSVFIAIFLVSFERYFIRKFYEWLHDHGILSQRALIYGAGYHGQRLERWIKQSPKLGIHVVGFLDDDIERLVKKPEAPAWLGGISQLKKVADKYQSNLLFIAHRKLEEEKIVEIFQKCREYGIKCWAIPSLYQFHVERAEFSNIGGIPLMSFRQGFARRSYAVVIKRFMDLLMSLPLAIVLFPFYALIAVCIKLTAGSPILFRQARVGLGGKRFVMYKFRTLKPGPKKGDDISPELKNESNYLPMGAFLRKTGLDELPQLWNVISGDMSLVGPRPEMPFIVEKYGPLERERLVVKPGVTGLWQISQDRKRLLIHENMDYDLYYVEHQSFNLDLAILVKTFFTVSKRFLEKQKKK